LRVIQLGFDGGTVNIQVETGCAQRGQFDYGFVAETIPLTGTPRVRVEPGDGQCFADRTVNTGKPRRASSSMNSADAMSTAFFRATVNGQIAAPVAFYRNL